MAEYAISAYWDVNLPVGLNVVDETLDKAHSVRMPIEEMRLDVLDEEYDRAIGAIVEINQFGTSAIATQDRSAGILFSVLDDAGMAATPGTARATSAVFRIDEVVGLAGLPLADRAAAFNVLQDWELLLDPVADRAIESQMEVETEFSLDLHYLMRANLGMPPEGKVYLLRGTNSASSDEPLDGSTLQHEREFGLTTILQVDVQGTRLDAYLIEFWIRANPTDERPLVYKNSLGGGITPAAPFPVLSNTGDGGVKQRLIAEIILEPDDLIAVRETKMLFFDCHMSQEGMAERYRIDKGKFTLVI